MSAIVYANIYSWARQALTGDPTSASLTDAQLSLPSQSQARRLLALYPCIADGSGGISLSATDTANFEEAVGLYVAAKIISTPGGKTYLSGIEAKIGPITESSITLTMTEAQSHLKAEGTLAISRIVCIATNRYSAFSRSGRSVAYPPPTTIIQQEFGVDGSDSQGDF